MIQDNGVFFFPDFVTENFTVDQILKCYSNWIKDLGGILTTEEKDVLNQRLIESKIRSEDLILASKNEGITKGFEDILIIYGELNNFASLRLLLSYHLDITPLNKAVFCP